MRYSTPTLDRIGSALGLVLGVDYTSLVIDDVVPPPVPGAPKRPVQA
jgi:hypothetical protein